MHGSEILEKTGRGRERWVRERGRKQEWTEEGEWELEKRVRRVDVGQRERGGEREVGERNSNTNINIERKVNANTGVISKIVELILLELLQNELRTACEQFGFKKC